MAEGVVDLLETVQVEEIHGKGRLPAAHLLEQVQEAALVEQAGQGVGVGQHLKRHPVVDVVGEEQRL